MADRSNLRSKIEWDAIAMFQTAASRLKTEDFRVIQGVRAVREDLLVLVQSGA